MVSVFDTIPNNFFNLLSSNSNYRTNAALLQFIYEQYDNEISYAFCKKQMERLNDYKDAKFTADVAINILNLLNIYSWKYARHYGTRIISGSAGRYKTL